MWHFLAHYNEAAGYEDAYLISLEGHVVFSARRRDDFGADLRAAPYRETELARVCERALMLMATELSDFARYAPAGTPVAFLATPLCKPLVSAALLHFSSVPTKCTGW